jgi:hypothetical protein
MIGKRIVRALPEKSATTNKRLKIDENTQEVEFSSSQTTNISKSITPESKPLSSAEESKL